MPSFGSFLWRSPVQGNGDGKKAHPVCFLYFIKAHSFHVIVSHLHNTVSNEVLLLSVWPKNWVFKVVNTAIRKNASDRADASTSCFYPSASAQTLGYTPDSGAHLSRLTERAAEISCYFGFQMISHIWGRWMIVWKFGSPQGPAVKAWLLGGSPTT